MVAPSCIGCERWMLSVRRLLAHAFLSKYDGENDAMRWNRHLTQCHLPSHFWCPLRQCDWLQIFVASPVHWEHTLWVCAVDPMNIRCKRLSRVHVSLSGLRTELTMTLTTICSFNAIYVFSRFSSAISMRVPLFIGFHKIDSCKFRWLLARSPATQPMNVESNDDKKKRKFNIKSFDGACGSRTPCIDRTINFIWCFLWSSSAYPIGQMSNECVCENKKIRFQ